MEQRVEQFDTPPPNFAATHHATNGFSSRVSAAQVASYLVIGLSVCVYFAATSSIFPEPWLMAMSGVALASLVVSSAFATCTNPTDRVVYYYKWSRHDRTIDFVPQYNKVLFCQYCDSYCLANSKHCRSCNRCVDRFDHHCMWFNNCVGRRNYWAFFISIVSTFIYAVFLLAHIILASIEVDYSDSSQLGKIVVSWIVAILMLIFGFLLFNLIILHIYLFCTNQTTYQFLQRRKREEEAEKQQLRETGSSNKVHPSDMPRHNNIASSQQSMANTKLVVIGQQSDEFRVSDKAQSKGEQRQSDFFEEQLQRHSNSRQEEEIKSANIVRSVAQNDPTVNNDDRMSEQSDPLPFFLRKNKSLRLLLGGQKTEQPSSSKRVATQTNTTGRIE